MDLELLAQAVLISFILMQFVNTLIKPLVAIINASVNGEPIKEMILELWPMYLTLLIAGGIGWFANLDLLKDMLPSPMGRILTSMAIGLGPSFIYDLLDKPESEVIISVGPEVTITQGELSGPTE